MSAPSLPDCAYSEMQEIVVQPRRASQKQLPDDLRRNYGVNISVGAMSGPSTSHPSTTSGGLPACYSNALDNPRPSLLTFSHEVHNGLLDLQVEKRLSKSERGEVYLAQWTTEEDGQTETIRVAVKVVPQRGEYYKRLHAGVYEMVDCPEHPNIVCVHFICADTAVEPLHKRLAQMRSAASCMSKRPHKRSFTSPFPRRSLSATRQPPFASRSLSATTGAGPRGSANNSMTALHRTSAPSLSLVVISELCEGPTLRHAIRDEVFFHVREIVARAPGVTGPRVPSSRGPPKLKMLCVLLTLLDIARALRHLHRHQLVHGSMCPAHVMLHTMFGTPRGFTAKLSGLGSVRVHDKVSAARRQQQGLTGGSVTHLAPEILLGDTSHQFYHDVYAFGILMWDVVASDLQDAGPYEGRSPQQIAQDVAFSNLRPKFSRTLKLPLQYVDLARRCWAMDPKARPNTEELVGAIGRMLLTVGVQEPPEWPAGSCGAIPLRLGSGFPTCPAASSGHL